MPTAILLDVSLSMMKPANRNPPNPEVIDSDLELVNEEATLSILNLAQVGIGAFMRHLDENHKLEYVCVVGFSSQCDLLSPFTRDFISVTEKVRNVSVGDSTHILTALSNLSAYILDQWSTSVPVNIVLITDGGVGNGPMSLSRIPTYDSDLLPFGFPGTFTVFCLAPVDDPEVFQSKLLYEKLIEKTGMEGKVILPESANGNISKSAVEKIFEDYCAQRYEQFKGTLRLGTEMPSPILLWPPPKPVRIVADFDVIEAHMEGTIDIKGFLTLADVSSPPILSKHIVFPYIMREDGSMSTLEEDARTPTLGVFVHGPLKNENMCALVQVATQNNLKTNWFGLLMSSTDSKKKSILMLSLLEPGNTPVPWLGDLRRLGLLSDLNQSSSSPFPVKASSQKPSYSNSPVVWIKESNLISDLQKVLRNARRLPDKSPTFYKELNRFKKAALTLGFHQLIDGLAEMCDRERKQLPSSSHPECSFQLAHVVKELRSSNGRKFDYDIVAAVPSKSGSKRD